MRRAAAFAAGIPLVALASIYIVYAVWDRLIRAEMIPGDSLAWFPTIAVVWGCVCIGAGGVLYRARRPHPRRAAKKPRG